MAEPLGFAVIGLGAISSMHLEAVSSIPDAKLVAVATRNPQRAREVAERYGCEGYSDYRQALQRDDVHVVCILTPSGTHREIVLDAAAAGKHMIVEKPLETTVERIDEMIAASESAGVLLSCIFQLRFKPVWQLVKKAVDGGWLGRVLIADAYNKWYRTPEYYASASWRGTWALDGGGALMNQGIHLVDLLQWVMGGVAEVSAYTAALRHDIEVEDSAVAVLKFKNGALGVLEATTSVLPGYPTRMEIHGELGSVRVADERVIEWSGPEPPAGHAAALAALKGQEGMQSTAADPRQTDATWHRLQIEDVISALRTGREPLVGAREARKSVAIIQAIYQSAREGRPVPVDG